MSGNTHIQLTCTSVAVFCMTVRMYVSMATKLIVIPDVVDKSIVIFITLLLMIDLLHRKYTIKALVLSVILSILVLISAWKSGEYTLLYTVLLIFAIGKQNLKSFLSRYFPLKVGLVLLIATIYTMGILFGLIEITYKDDRFSFTGGFPTGNVFGFICFWLVAEYMYLRFEKLKTSRIVILLLFQLIIAWLTQSNSIMVTALIWSVGYYSIQRGKFPRKALRLTSMWLYIVLGGLYILAIEIFNARNGVAYQVVYNIDLFLTGRIRNTAYLESIYGMTWFGQVIRKGDINYDSYYQLTRVTVDGGYALFILQAGLIFFIIASLGFWRYSRRANTLDIERFLIITYSFYTLSEMMVANGLICFPVLLLGHVIFRKKATEHNGLQLKL